MNKIQFKITFLGVIFLALVLLSGCLMQSSPPGPNTAYGSIEGVSYTFHQWAEGLSVMIWHDLNGESGCTGSGSSSDPVYRENCTAEGTDGRSLEWQIHTTDGVTAEMRINGTEYDLNDGNLFLINYQDGEAHIVQQQRDLSTVATTHESVTAFAPTDQEVSTFVESVIASRLSVDDEAVQIPVEGQSYVEMVTQLLVEDLAISPEQVELESITEPATTAEPHIIKVVVGDIGYEYHGFDGEIQLISISEPVPAVINN